MRRFAVWAIFAFAVYGQDKFLARYDPVQRIRELERSLDAARKTGGPREQGIALQRLGNAMKVYGDYGSATARLEEAALQFRRTRDLPAVARAHMSLGRVYWRQGRLDIASQEYRTALSIYERLEDRSGMISVHQELGVAFAMLGKRKEGLELSQKAFEMTGQDGTPVAVRRGQIGLALSYNEIGEYHRAAQIVEQVLRQFPRQPLQSAHWILSASYFHLGMYEESRRAADRGVKRASRASFAENEILARWWRARALDKLGRTEEAAGDMLKALGLIEKVRSSVTPEDSFKRSFAERSQPLAGDAIAVLWNAGRTREALELAERARARAFLDLLASRDSNGRSIPSSVLPSPEEEEPNLPSGVSFAAASADALAALAKRLDSYILAYWVHPEAIYAWLVTPSGSLHAERVLVREEELNQWIDRARSGVERTDTEAWRNLYRLLIQPLRDKLPRKPGADLTILPHRALFQLPFAALTGPTGRYLLEDFTLRTAPAAAVLDLTAPRNALPSRYLLVGGPATLPGARREIQQIAAGSGRHAVVLSGKDANEDQVRASAPVATVLHFATHAALDPERPFGSYLELHGADRLTAAEIYDLRLNADLVILAACRSGLGKLSADGLLGLTRAFFYAGARSVIVPLWDVADQPTMRLMTEFHRHYQAHGSNTRALQSAQLRLLNDLKAGRVEVTTPAGPMILPERPWLWAGFVVQGED